MSRITRPGNRARRASPVLLRLALVSTPREHVGPAPLPASGQAEPTHSGLVRGIGRWATVALVLNGIIGAGIFGLPSRIHALAGVAGLWAFAVCAVVVTCIALCFVEVSSRFTHTGGPYLYTQEAFGPLAGFLSGWLMWITRVTAVAVISNVMVSYFAFFWAPAGAGWGRAVTMTAVAVVLTGINLVGVRQAAGAVSAFTIGKLVPILLFVGVGLFFVDPHAFSTPSLRVPGAFEQAVLQLIFAFGGFETSVVAAGEIQDPRRNLPFALLIGIGTTAALYLLIQVVCIGTLPGLAASTKPLADAATRFMGTPGGSVIAIGALVSTVGTMCASLLAGPRLLFAMSEGGRLPAVFARVHPRFRTPHIAILATAAMSLALSVTGTFSYLIGLNVIARLLVYLSTAAASIAFRRRRDSPSAAVSIPAWPVVVALTLGACLWLLARSGGRELRDVAIALVIGLGLYVARRPARRR
jgi:APA family basic amino acid/polyamine antiporter